MPFIRKYATQEESDAAYYLATRKSQLAKYGLTLQDYADMFEAQSGLCAICDQPGPVHEERLAVDHCHVTGKVRGLLCRNCNVGIGQLGDNLARVRRAVAYLERAESNGEPNATITDTGQSDGA